MCAYYTHHETSECVKKIMIFGLFLTLWILGRFLFLNIRMLAISEH